MCTHHDIKKEIIGVGLTEHEAELLMKDAVSTYLFNELDVIMNNDVRRREFYQTYDCIKQYIDESQVYYHDEEMPDDLCNAILQTTKDIVKK